MPRPCVRGRHGPRIRSRASPRGRGRQALSVRRCVNRRRRSRQGLRVRRRARPRGRKARRVLGVAVRCGRVVGGHGPRAGQESFSGPRRRRRGTWRLLLRRRGTPHQPRSRHPTTPSTPHQPHGAHPTTPSTPHQPHGAHPTAPSTPRARRRYRHRCHSVALFVKPWRYRRGSTNNATARHVPPRREQIHPAANRSAPSRTAPPHIEQLHTIANSDEPPLPCQETAARPCLTVNGSTVPWTRAVKHLVPSPTACPVGRPAQ